MHTFTDNQGDEWSVSLDTVTLRELKKTCGVDLLALDESSLIAIESDDAKLVDVISFVCTQQIERRQLDEVGFARRLIGDVLESACEALMSELFTICRPARRKVLAAAWEKVDAVKNLQVEKALNEIENLNLDELTGR